MCDRYRYGILRFLIFLNVLYIHGKASAWWAAPGGGGGTKAYLTRFSIYTILVPFTKENCRKFKNMVKLDKWILFPRYWEETLHGQPK